MSERAESPALRRPSPLPIVLGLAVVVLLAVWAHLYFAKRLVLESALPQPWSGLALALLATGCAVLFAHPIAERRFGPAAGGVLGWPAYLWLGCSFYLLLSLWASELVLLIAGLEGVAAARVRAVAVCGVTLLMAGAAASSGLRPARLRRVELALPGWPAALDGYRIVQISDIHVGSLIRAAFVRRLVERCNAREADLIAITGDLVDGSVEHYGEDVAAFGRLQARDGVYFVTGNHDHFSGAQAWTQHLAGLGITVLRNRRLRIERSEASFELAGVDDFGSARRRQRAEHDLAEALEGWSGTTPLVLLAHDPRSFEIAKQRGVSLQLSGHTHGGQLWPFSLMVRLQTPYVAGVYRHRDSTLYVSRGTAFWGPPMRLFAPAEITELVLRAAPAA